MKYCLGIDIGSRNTKIVLIEIESRNIAYCDFCDTGINPVQTVNSLINKAKSILRCSEDNIIKTYCTGYGRKMLKSDKVVSEISCHSFGVLHERPEVRTIIDIGGQDSKIVTLDENQHIIDFVMNDKCAAGTGRFLEMVALRLSISCSQLSEIASKSEMQISLNNTCVVFAESEIIGLISKGITANDIAKAVNLSIASRIASQLNQLNWKPPVAITGGVALNKDLYNSISKLIDCRIIVPDNPEITGALGAAIMALNDYEKD